MPNIPALAPSVVKHKFFATAILFVLWILFVVLMPITIITTVNAALSGWFVGKEIYKLSVKWEDYFNEA